MLKFYCLITGDEYNLLKNETPKSRKQVRLFAVSIFIPVLMWAVNSFLLASEVLKKNTFTSVLTMLILMTLIFVIEKAIIMSNGSKSIAAFRILLGFIIACIGSLALDEVVFKNDIDTQIEENKRLYVTESTNNLRADLNNKILLQENKMKEKDSLWQQAYNEAIHEADGTGGTGFPNVGQITQLKLKRADIAKTEYDKSKTEVSNLKISSDSIINNYENNISKSFNDNSLLLRIKAMFDLVSKDGWMMLVYLLFTALIFLLESVVIIIKLCSKETNYEKKMKLIEEIGAKRMNLILENNSQVFDSVIFKDNLKSSSDLIKRPMRGMFN